MVSSDGMPLARFLHEKDAWIFINAHKGGVMKHTPGPWKWVGVENYTGWMERLVSTSTDDTSWPVICPATHVVDRNDPDKTRAHAIINNYADAPLIAAAPDLLEAALEIIEYLGDPVPPLTKAAEAYLKLHRAAAKAMGRVRK